MKVEFVPTIEKSSVKMRLQASIRRCELIQGAIAFWTIPIDFFHGLGQKLNNENSFICIDIDSPTNIDRIAEFVRNGSNFFIHAYKLVQRVENENEIKGLMHAKIIHFEFDNNETETWIGSHNFTKRALLGVNIEASVIISTQQETKEEVEFVKNTKNYLEFIKSVCEPFDINKIDFYKTLQGDRDFEDVFDVIELVGKNINQIPDEGTIQIVSKDISNFEKYKLINKKVILHCLDLDTQKEFLYETSILNAGAINTSNVKSYEMTFSERRYAIREKDMLPYLHKENVIDAKLLKISQYYINLTFVKPLIGYSVFEKPINKDNLWEYFSESPHIKRLDEDSRKNLFSKRNIVKKGSNKINDLKRICLNRIIPKIDQEYLIANYENNKFGIRYKTEEEIDKLDSDNQFQTEIPESIKRKQLFVKRIIKENQTSGLKS